LGAICHQYERDFHGQIGGINAGLPTDRFYVEWWVTTSRVKVRLASRRPPLTLDNYLSGGAIMVNKAEADKRGFTKPATSFEQVESRFVLAEIPTSIQAIKMSDMGLAQAWRQLTREIFEHYFRDNYILTDFVRFQDAAGSERSYYVLTHGDGQPMKM
jgi:predicted GNAT superfamily acetyltransferase